MRDLETIKFLNSPRGFALAQQIARACNRVRQDENCPKHVTSRKLVKKRK